MSTREVLSASETASVSVCTDGGGDGGACISFFCPKAHFSPRLSNAETLVIVPYLRAETEYIMRKQFALVAARRAEFAAAVARLLPPVKASFFFLWDPHGTAVVTLVVRIRIQVIPKLESREAHWRAVFGRRTHLTE